MSSDTRSQRPARARRRPPAPDVPAQSVSSPSSTPVASSPTRARRRKRRRQPRSISSSRPTAPVATGVTSTPPRSSAPPSPSSPSSSDSDFLLTAAERRQRRLLQPSPSTSSSTSPSSTTPPPHTSTSPSPSSSSPPLPPSPPHPHPIPGYHYDPTQRRYFKITVGHDFGRERRLQRLERSSLSHTHRQPPHLRTTPAASRHVQPHPTGDDSRLYAEWAQHTPSSSLFSALTRRSLLPSHSPSHDTAVRRSLFAGGLSLSNLFTPECAALQRSCLPWSAEHGLAYGGATAPYLAISGVRHGPPFMRDPTFHVTLVHLTPRLSPSSTVIDASGDDAPSPPADCPFSVREVHQQLWQLPLTSCHVVPGIVASSVGDAGQPHAATAVVTHLDHLSYSSPMRVNPSLLLAVLSVPFGSTFASSPHPHFPSRSTTVALAHTGGLSLIDSHTSRVTLRFRCGKSDQMATTWHPTNPSLLFAGGRDGCMRLFDVRLGARSPPVLQQMATASPHVVGGVSMMRGVGEGQWGLVVASGGELGLWDERRWGGSKGEWGKVVGFEEWRGELGCGTTAVTPDGRWLMAGDDRGVVRVWEVRTGKMVKEIVGVRGRSLMQLERSEAQVRRAGVVQHVVWLDEYQSMLVGSESGIACYTLSM